MLVQSLRAKDGFLFFDPESLKGPTVLASLEEAGQSKVGLFGSLVFIRLSKMAKMIRDLLATHLHELIGEEQQELSAALNALESGSLEQIGSAFERGPALELCFIFADEREKRDE